ncbi:MAG TPA: ethanolamine ammonia-lyase light chain EutC, partial [Xanthobacteraceae bacterium]|nr:ethanolamine ammonia-lyase light chain EutC [Xanthobacteraceae bacterium]
MTDESHRDSKPAIRDAASDPNPWKALRAFTAARIGLPRSGASLATKPLLEFKLAHARARDAVHAPFDDARLQADLGALGVPVLLVASAADDRQHFLMRPDLGRRLAADGLAELAAHAGKYDVAFVVSDGLSAVAVQNHAQPVLAQLLPLLRSEGWRIAPITVVRRGRVAIGDAVAAALDADIVVVLI